MGAANSYLEGWRHDDRIMGGITARSIVSLTRTMGWESDL